MAFSRAPREGKKVFSRANVHLLAQRPQRRRGTRAPRTCASPADTGGDGRHGGGRKSRRGWAGGRRVGFAVVAGAPTCTRQSGSSASASYDAGQAAAHCGTSLPLPARLSSTTSMSEEARRRVPRVAESCLCCLKAVTRAREERLLPWQRERSSALRPWGRAGALVECSSRSSHSCAPGARNEARKRTKESWIARCAQCRVPKARLLMDLSG